MSDKITVSDIRRALEDLPNDYPVVIRPIAHSEWDGQYAHLSRACCATVKGHQALLLILGDFVTWPEK